ncbi:MAG: response regulator [bacterium]
MTPAHGHDGSEARAIARGLRVALDAAFASRGPDAQAWSAAVDVAEILGLEGLADVLREARRHREPRPAGLDHALERVQRLATECEGRGDLAAFTEADRELAALAATIAQQEWVVTPGVPAPPTPAQSLADLLADLPVEDATVLARGVVSLPVSAALRAALDWLGADEGGPIQVATQDGVVTLTFRVVHTPGLSPAGSVLALVGGALVPVDATRWSVRVPLHADRPPFLLARQGELRLAVPWHAVANLRITAAAVREAFEEPSLAPWSPYRRPEGERPSALLAQGLSRAWLHLDHIVWRVFATPEPAHAPAEVPGSHLAVHTDDGEAYWVVDAVAALRAVPPVDTPPPSPRPRASSPSAFVARPASAAPMSATSATAEPVAGPAPEPTPAPAPAPRPSTIIPMPVPRPAPRPASTEPALLGREHVVPIAGRPRPVTPAPRRAPVEAPRPAARRALVVDDSMVARLALGRVLEAHGWVVEGVESASAMWQAIDDQDWDAVFLDVSLPDAIEREHLRQAVARRLVVRKPFEIVALTRDRSEDRLATAAGILETVRKPFGPDALEGLARRLDADARG